MIRVLFVCLGNICRSPMAEAIFEQMVAEAGLSDKISVDSAGTGDWHTGEPAHPGTRAILQAHGIPYSGRSRQIRHDDMADHSSYIVAMDDSNLSTLRRRFGDHPRLYKLLDFAPHLNETNVPDPYYTGDYETVYKLVKAGCQGLLATLKQEMASE